MMCMTMFCYIPCPFHTWDDEARPLMTLFLPVVGAWIGILWTLCAYLIEWLGSGWCGNSVCVSVSCDRRDAYGRISRCNRCGEVVA